MNEINSFLFDGFYDADLFAKSDFLTPSEQEAIGEFFFRISCDDLFDEFADECVEELRDLSYDSLDAEDIGMLRCKSDSSSEDSESSKIDLEILGGSSIKRAFYRHFHRSSTSTLNQHILVDIRKTYPMIQLHQVLATMDTLEGMSEKSIQLLSLLGVKKLLNLLRRIKGTRGVVQKKVTSMNEQPVQQRYLPKKMVIGSDVSNKFKLKLTGC